MAKNEANPVTATPNDKHVESCNTTTSATGTTTFNGGERERRIDPSIDRRIHDALNKLSFYLNKAKSDNLKPKVISNSIKNCKVNYNNLLYLNERGDKENKYVNKKTEKLIKYIEYKKLI